MGLKNVRIVESRECEFVKQNWAVQHGVKRLVILVVYHQSLYLLLELHQICEGALLMVDCLQMERPLCVKPLLELGEQVEWQVMMFKPLGCLI